MDKISTLKKLKTLLDEGIINEDDFKRQKKLILDEIDTSSIVISSETEREDQTSSDKKEVIPIRNTKNVVSTNKDFYTKDINNAVHKEDSVIKGENEGNNGMNMVILIIALIIVGLLVYFLGGSYSAKTY